MAERKRFKYIINVRTVRDLLGEHQVTFPEILLLSPQDERWLKDRDGNPPGGQCNYYAQSGRCAIFLRSDGYLATSDARTVIIHELRHWWQDVDTTRSRQLSRSYLTRLYLELGLVFTIALTIALAFIAAGLATGLIFGLWLFSSGLLLLWASDGALAKALYCWRWRLPLRFAKAEHDATRFTIKNWQRPEWKAAIVIQEVDQNKTSDP